MGNRRQLLESAADLVEGDRNAAYGDPIDDFRRTSRYWSTHIGGVLRRKVQDLVDEDGTILYEDLLWVVDQLLDPHDVAVMMTQLKMSRLAWSPQKQDSYVDAAGYMACGWDCALREEASLVDDLEDDVNEVEVTQEDFDLEAILRTTTRQSPPFAPVGFEGSAVILYDVPGRYSPTYDLGDNRIVR